MIPNVEEFLSTLQLKKGGHQPDGEFCAMEAAAYIAGEQWTDRPKCVSAVIAAFLRSWNDALDDDSRQILKPYLVKVINTAGPRSLETKRAWIATDWLARECAPAFLRLAGLTEHAETLENLVALTGSREAKKAQPQLASAGAAARAAAGDAAWAAARASAWDAAWDAAGAAAGDAAGDAAWAAARAVAGAAAWAAAWDAAGNAAGDAAGDKLQLTVKALQASALLMLDRMIEAKGE